MIDDIRHRLELARELPELVGTDNSAANRWIEDVTLLLAENDRLQAVVEAARALRAAKTNTTEQGWGTYFKEMPALENLYQALAALDKESTDG